MLRPSALLILFLGSASPASPPSPLAAQASDPRPQRVRLEGRWQAKTEDEIRNIMVRSDSSAQFGDQVSRWRVVGDSWQLVGYRLPARARR